MDSTEFRSLVDRLQNAAAAHPRAYRLRCGGLAVLGYAYVIGVLLLLIGLLAAVIALAAVARGGGAVVAKLAIPIVLVMYAIARSLWVRIPPPEGLALTRSSAPRLFAALDDMRRTLAAPRFHSVLLTDDFNASVVQVPRLGVFGWQRNYLMVGLPLMQALSPDQFRAVLAHEMGHLSGNHSRFSGWIYRVRATWGRMLGQLEAQGSGLGQLLFTRFVRWYAPFFNAYSFVLARANEYEADRCSAEVAGADTAGAALLRLRVAQRFLSETFWPSVFRRVSETPEAPEAIYTAHGRALHEELPTCHIAPWVDTAWQRPTDYADTHPSLADRLTALGVAREASPGLVASGAAGETAATRFLGSRETGLTGELERGWREQMAPRWEARHKAILEARVRLTALDAKATAEPLTPDEHWERIGLTAEFDQAAAVPLAEALLAVDAEHTGARMFLGRSLLEQGDEAGVGHLEAAMRVTSQAVLPACESLFDFYWTRGRRDEAERYRRMGEAHGAVLDAVRAERTSVPDRKVLRPHDLPPDFVARLRETLAEYPLAEVYLARREVERLPEVPCYVIGIVPRRKWYHLTDARKDALLRDRVMNEIVWPQETYGFLATGELGHLRKKLRAIPNSTVVG
ncbi:MAG TPA: M48 family metallopeptidase [Gemmatimonadales bacterium]|nr:M48 family metallopeptidase [Gemmatimonadales bacterium]